MRKVELIFKELFRREIKLDSSYMVVKRNGIPIRILRQICTGAPAMDTSKTSQLGNGEKHTSLHEFNSSPLRCWYSNACTFWGLIAMIFWGMTVSLWKSILFSKWLNVAERKSKKGKKGKETKALSHVFQAPLHSPSIGLQGWGCTLTTEALHLVCYINRQEKYDRFKE